MTFLDHHADPRAYRLQQFLDLPLLAIVSADTLEALTRALLETGNRQIHLLDSRDETTDYGRITELLEVLQRDRDPDIMLHTATVADWHDDACLQAVLASFKVVVYFTTKSSPSPTHRLAELCYRAGVILIPAVTQENEIIIGPTQHPDIPGCWQCYWQRRQAALGNNDVTPTYPTQLSITALAVVANLLAFECFKQGTHVKIETLDKQAFVLELEQLQSVTHRVFPHPTCTICSTPSSTSPDSLRNEIAILQHHQTILDIQDFLKDTEQWADISSGIFTRIDEQDFFQLPLIRSQITVTSPLAQELLIAHAAGLSYQEAREQAVRQAVDLYQERLVDSRRIQWVVYEQLRTQQSVLHPQSFFGWLGKSLAVQQPMAWLWAWQLDERSPVLVPTAAVYPHSFYNTSDEGPIFQQDIPGTGIGVTWHEAIARGLQSLGKVVDVSYKVASRISHLAYIDDSICAAYLKILAIMNHEVTLLDITGDLGLPRIVAYLGDQYIGMTTHWNIIAAIREALKMAVLTAQMERSPHPKDGIVASPLPGVDWAIHISNMPITVTLPHSLVTETDFQEAATMLQDCFKQQGWKLLVTPLSIDSTVATALGCALRVTAVKQDTIITGESKE